MKVLSTHLPLWWRCWPRSCGPYRPGRSKAGRPSRGRLCPFSLD